MVDRNRRFEDKVVFISGVARGQGREHAIRFAREGARVITGRSPSAVWVINPRSPSAKLPSRVITGRSRLTPEVLLSG